MPIKDLPLDAQPREKLAQRGAAALSDAELLAVILRTGMAGKTVLQMAQELLELPGDRQGTGGLAGLLAADYQALTTVKGLGPAKRAELMAVLELARRATAQQLREREVFSSPEAVKHYLQLHLAARPHEVFAVLFLDSQNRLLALEEMFRGTLTQITIPYQRKDNDCVYHWRALRSQQRQFKLSRPVFDRRQKLGGTREPKDYFNSPLGVGVQPHPITKHQPHAGRSDALGGASPKLPAAL